MTASVPSRIAFATSDVSARVGPGYEVIDSSICVAVITGMPYPLADWMICFCTSGTWAKGSSTPRSPRATITASLYSRIPSSSSTAPARSILATSHALPFMWAFSTRTSRTFCTKDSPTYSASIE